MFGSKNEIKKKKIHIRIDIFKTTPALTAKT